MAERTSSVAQGGKAQAKSLETTLQEQLEFTRAITSSLGEGVYALDTKGRMTYMNAAAERMLGWQQEDLLGKVLHNAVHYKRPTGEPMAAKDCPLLRVLDHETSGQTGTDHFVRKDGSLFPISYVSSTIVREGVIKGLVLSFLDISETVESAKALQESEARFRLMAESMPQKMFTAMPNGSLDYCNHEWVNYTGFTERALKGLGWSKCIHPDDVDDNLQRWQYSIDTGQPFQFEQRIRRHDGTYRWHLSRARAMRDSNGSIIKWIGSNTDIDDFKHRQELELLNASLKKQRAALLAINRAKDEFISLASHQLRTPATGVKQYLGMLLEGFAGNLEPTQLELLKHAYSSNERQITVVNDLLRVALIDAGRVDLKLEPVDLGIMLQQVFEDQAGTFKSRQQKVKLVPSPQPAIANADPDKLRQVIDNIVDNASKYTYKGDQITLSLEHKGNLVAVVIADQGVGMRPEAIARIFDKFTRLDNPLSVEVGGSGLGLYWAHKIVQLHGGVIEVASELGKGSTFKIWLPAVKGENK